jgi:hypothetical protein
VTNGRQVPPARTSAARLTDEYGTGLTPGKRRDPPGTVLERESNDIMQSVLRLQRRVTFQEASGGAA